VVIHPALPTGHDIDAPIPVSYPRNGNLSDPTAQQLVRTTARLIVIHTEAEGQQ
jgi:hypothetical protein